MAKQRPRRGGTRSKKLSRKRGRSTLAVGVVVLAALGLPAKGIVSYTEVDPDGTTRYVRETSHVEEVRRVIKEELAALRTKLKSAAADEVPKLIEAIKHRTARLEHLVP